MIGLSILAGVVAAVGIMGWRRTRLRDLPALSEVPSTLHPKPARAELGVWRPPPRQQLLARQLAARLAERERDGESPRDPGPRRILTERSYRQSRRVVEILGDNPQERREPRAIDPVLRLPAGEPPVSRIGRKRQGLESLITELPSVIEEDRHDSNVS